MFGQAGDDGRLDVVPRSPSSSPDPPRPCRSTSLSIVIDLQILADRARREGWAVGAGDLESVRHAARALGWVEVPQRRGDPPVSVLRPLGPTQAHPNSLSALHGLGPQPLHTDGAHLPRTPDLVILVSTRVSATATRLWRAALGSCDSSVRDALAHGMFLVRSGKESFYASARDKGRYRYDPGCMSPCDIRAGIVERFFRDALSSVHEHEWVSVNQVLVLDNTAVLHARDAIQDGDDNRELLRLALYTGGAS